MNLGVEIGWNGAGAGLESDVARQIDRVADHDGATEGKITASGVRDVDAFFCGRGFLRRGI